MHHFSYRPSLGIKEGLQPSLDPALKNGEPVQGAGGVSYKRGMVFRHVLISSSVNKNYLYLSHIPAFSTQVHMACR